MANLKENLESKASHNPACEGLKGQAAPATKVSLDFPDMFVGFEATHTSSWSASVAVP